MMEHKLYYQNAYIRSFTANITKQAQDELGNWYIVMDQTAFYPTGGGQPNDIGTVNGKKVINVEEKDGEIRHFLEKPLNITDQEVKCNIDWQRRFDHMQQHCGQHLLSAAFDTLFHYRTVSFHLGHEVLTIDLETDHLSEQEVNEAEKLTNQIILENRPIETKWVTEAELSRYPLRKQTKVKEDIRLVIVPDFDYNGCGGTHPKTTGEVRAVKILNWERQKHNIRVQFICGERVIRQFHQKQEIALELTKLLNTPETEWKAAVTRLLCTNKELEKTLKTAQEKLLEYEAKELYRENVMKWNGYKVISRVYQNRSIKELQTLARLCITGDQLACVILIAENDNRLQLVLAKGTIKMISMNKLIGDILPLIKGKGGGNETFAQGGGEPTMTGEKLLDQVLTNISAF